MTNAQRVGLVAATVVVLVVAFVVLRPGGGDGGSSQSSTAASAPSTSSPGSTAGATATTGTAAPQPAFQTVRVVNGQPQGGIKKLSVKKGDQVRLRVISDVADEIHIHGYDLKRDVAKGGSARFSFPATIEGRFEIELENAGTQIADLEVTPS